MFFVRTTLLLGLGVWLLPTDRDSQARVFSGAKTAVDWSVTFCDRNPQTCVQSRQAWDVFVKKAEFGGRMALDLINSSNQAAPPASTSGATVPARTAPQPPVKRSAGTLQGSDLEPAWRGRLTRTGG